MGTYDLIDNYLRLLRASVRHAPGGETALAEIEDHLHCAVEELEAGGVDNDSAQREALTRLGPPEVVARAIATGPQSGAALPTRSTVSGGAMPLLAGGVWLIYALTTFAVVHLYDRVEGQSAEDSSTPLGTLIILPWGIGLIGGMALLLATALILKERHGGFHWTGWLAVGILGLGCAASLIGWVMVGWGTLLAAGAALLAIELLRAGITPRGATLAIAAGPAIGWAVWGLLAAVDLRLLDSLGDYAAPTGVAVGCAVLAAGLVGIGRWLQGEESVDLAGLVADPDLATPA